MSSLLKVSDAAAMALHAVAFLAAYPDQRFSVREIAGPLRVSITHLSKVLQRLARVGVLGSSRGVGGGFQLGRAPEKITLQEVFRAVEGSLDSRPCLMREPLCNGDGCILGGLLPQVNRLVEQRLAGTTLADLGAGFRQILENLRARIEPG